ncbi:MAG: DUF3291 domain-containing protein [Dehalococcoidia bacterium]|nr:DUF3291 domain-containing protein [Dehalococcoidia bacterium]
MAQRETPQSRTEEYLCIATRLVVKRRRDIVPFLFMTWRVTRQLKKSPGFVCHGLNAEMRERTFFTYTVWKDRASVNAFVRAEPHATAVGRMERWSGEGSAFAEWTSRDSGINWPDAFERLKNPTRYYRRRAS